MTGGELPLRHRPLQAVVVHSADQARCDLGFLRPRRRSALPQILEYSDQGPLTVPIVRQVGVKPVQCGTQVGISAGFPNAVKSMSDNAAGEAIKRGIFG